MTVKILRPYQQQALDQLRVKLRDNVEPQLVDASVGSGKSLILSALLMHIERANWRALCLTMNSTLIGQNADTYRDQGGTPGLFCSGLGEKNSTANVIFASPHSITQAIKQKGNISKVKFNLIIVDECHNINHKDRSTMYMRILNHYGFMAQSGNYKYRIVGLTGTPYRGAVSIVGPDEFFKDKVCSITMGWLIDNGYLTPPVFGQTSLESFDMAALKTNSMGKFNKKELQKAVDQKERLTGQIMGEVVRVVEDGRNGAYIFASTIKHVHECMKSLPEHQSAFITGDTPHKERSRILERARQGDIKYLVNVATLLVGIDVTNFDVCAWLRPSESLTLYVQGIGRVLRLHEGKKTALILDYAGNSARHGDIDDPIIEAAQQAEEEKNEAEYVIPCHDCGRANTVHARRCIGRVNDKGKSVYHEVEPAKPEEITKRCDYYFTFKECTNEKCEAENDITARQCRLCGEELIDPNAKLQENLSMITLEVLNAKYWVTTKEGEYEPIIHAKYTLKKEKYIYESFYTKSEKAQRYTYGKFLKPHVPNYTKYYMLMSNNQAMKDMIASEEIKTPSHVTCKRDDFGKLIIARKLFD